MGTQPWRCNSNTHLKAVYGQLPSFFGASLLVNRYVPEIQIFFAGFDLETWALDDLAKLPLIPVVELELLDVIQQVELYSSWYDGSVGPAPGVGCNETGLTWDVFSVTSVETSVKAESRVSIEIGRTAEPSEHCLLFRSGISSQDQVR